MSIKNASDLLASSQLGRRDGLLWEWNGTDVSQFGDGDGTPTAVNGGTETGTLAAATLASSSQDVQTDKALVYTHSGATNVDVYYPINDLPPLPERFRIVAKLGPRESSNLGVGTYPGVILAWQDGTHFMRLQSNGSKSALIIVTGNGDIGSPTVYSSANDVSTTQSQDLGTLVDIYCSLGEPDTGVDPKMHFIVKPFNSTGFLGVGASTFSWTAAGGATPPNTSWNSGWQSGGTVRRPGIMFRETGTAGSGYVGMFKIYEV